MQLQIGQKGEIFLIYRMGESQAANGRPADESTVRRIATRYLISVMLDKSGACSV